MGQADNAVLAKVRALYGKGLTPSDYSQLLQKKSVADLARYLKQETDYAQDLAEVKEDLVHRGQLEQMIRRRTLRVYGKLMKYAGGEPLYLRLYILQNEIQQILAALRLLHAGRMDRFLVTLPVHLTRHMSFDLFALTAVRDFAGLLEVLYRSPYYRILSPFRLSGGAAVDVTLCEAALLSHYYGTGLSMVDKQYGGEARRDLRVILLGRMELHNAMVVLRMRKYRGAGRGEIEPRLVRVKGVHSPLLEQLLAAPDLPSLYAAAGRSRFLGGLDFAGGARDLAGQALRARRDQNRRLFRFSTQPVVVVVCYTALLEVEQSNLVHIIEGVRYGIPEPELRQLLCI